METFNRAEYGFYYIVKVLETEKTIKTGISNHQGTIIGITADGDLDDGDMVGYSVQFDDKQHIHFVWENELEWTGKIDDPDKFKPEGSVQITPYGTLAEQNSEGKS